VRTSQLAAIQHTAMLLYPLLCRRTITSGATVPQCGAPSFTLLVPDAALADCVAAATATAPPLAALLLLPVPCRR
jgi:hypothetical protein